MPSDHLGGDFYFSLHLEVIASCVCPLADPYGQRWEGELHANIDAVHVLELGIVFFDPRKDGGVGDAVHFPRHLRDLIPFLDGAHDHRHRLGEG